MNTALKPNEDLNRELGGSGVIRTAGRHTIDFLIDARGIYLLFIRTLYYVFCGKRERGAVLRQMYEIGYRSLFFMSLTMAFIGMILVHQAGVQAARIVPDYNMIGATFCELLVREIAPSIGALMLATRVGAGIAAELGSMVVTEQVDAIRMCAADPIDFLVVPRFLACLVMTPVLVVCAGTIALISGATTAHFAFGVSMHTFMNANLIHAPVIITCVIKCLAYGTAIPIISSYCGLSTFGGSEGVGWATTRAVVNSSLAIIVLNFTISVSSFLVFSR